MSFFLITACHDCVMPYHTTLLLIIFLQCPPQFLAPFVKVSRKGLEENPPFGEVASLEKKRKIQPFIEINLFGENQIPHHEKTKNIFIHLYKGCQWLQRVLYIRMHKNQVFTQPPHSLDSLFFFMFQFSISLKNQQDHLLLLLGQVAQVNHDGCRRRFSIAEMASRPACRPRLFFEISLQVLSMSRYLQIEVTTDAAASVKLNRGLRTGNKSVSVSHTCLDNVENLEGNSTAAKQKHRTRALAETNSSTLVKAEFPYIRNDASSFPGSHEQN